MKILLFFILFVLIRTNPSDDLTKQLQAVRTNRSLMGIQLRITQVEGTSSKILYHQNVGNKNLTHPIQNNTMFRVASLSKSFASVGIMQLVQAGKISLNQSISSILGFQIKNPFFPNTEITVQMILSHQSGLVQCDPYYSNFLSDTYNAKDGTQIPSLRQILMKGGKYYNSCLFSSTHEPGTYFLYVNLNFGISGTIIQTISGERFDEYMDNHVLKPLGKGQTNTPTFNAGNIQKPQDLGTIFVGNQGQWSPSYDNYQDGIIPKRNLTGYKIGSNGVIFGPQGGLRASVGHLTNYMQMYLNNGIFNGNKILSPSSTLQIFKNRYQYNGNNGPYNDFHLYGLGVYTTTYRDNDKVLDHEVLQGHLGAAYGLISAYFYWKNYTFAYIINGALNGYKYGTGTIYEAERLAIHSGVETFINSLEREKEVKIQEE